MGIIFRQCCRALLLAAIMLLLPPVLAHASPEIMPVDNIQPGMCGVAKTVISGTTIEDFDVEVLGIMKHKGPSGDLILVRTSGDVIDKSGGIAQGMSGSPVYIDGKLIGAIAYGWSLTDHRIGMVTPIEDMLKLLDIKEKTGMVFPPFNIAMPGNPRSTPLMAYGFSERALARLGEQLKPFNLVPYAAGSADGRIGETVPLEPGSAVGAVLINGDIGLGALGTVTYVDGDKVLAFGHPFLKKGNANYLMSEAYIWTTVSSLDNSFKVGATGAIIGTINQDRGAGIAGRLNSYPGIIPIKVTVHDDDLDVTNTYIAQLVQDGQLEPVLAENMVYNAIDKTLDRVGMGTAEIGFTITARSMPGSVLQRNNMFFHPSNISTAMTGEFLEAMTILAGNKYKPVDIMDINVNIKVSNANRVATIMEAKALTPQVKPGGKALIAVKLKPYRGSEITRTLAYIVPQGQAAGPLTVEVRGGGTVPLSTQLMLKQGLDGNTMQLLEDRFKNSTFEDIINEFSTRDHNNDLVVEPVLNMADITAALTPVTDNAAVAKPAQTTSVNANGNGQQGRTVLSTDYIIDSETQVSFDIVS